MHEMSLTHDVVDAVLEQAGMAEASSVVSVHLTIGAIHDIVDDLFVKCFAFLARGTIAEHARVDIERVPLSVQCKQCAERYPVDLWAIRKAPTCPVCGGGDYRIASGEEFRIDDIEVA